MSTGSRLLWKTRPTRKLKQQHANCKQSTEVFFSHSSEDWQQRFPAEFWPPTAAYWQLSHSSMQRVGLGFDPWGSFCIRPVWWAITTPGSSVDPAAVSHFQPSKLEVATWFAALSQSFNMVAQWILPSDYSAHPLLSIPPSLPVAARRSAATSASGINTSQLCKACLYQQFSCSYYPSHAPPGWHLGEWHSHLCPYWAAWVVHSATPGWKPPASGSLKISHGWRLLLHNQPKSRGKVCSATWRKGWK